MRQKPDVEIYPPAKCCAPVGCGALWTSWCPVENLVYCAVHILNHSCKAKVFVYGDPSLIVRFLASTSISAGCWNWRAGKTGAGYGAIKISGRTLGAHRVAYELSSGKSIPEKMEIDHLCRNRACVNPEHLEVVTAKENILRGTCPAAFNSKKIHCPMGHPYSKENTIRTTSSATGTVRRICRICNKAAFHKRKNGGNPGAPRKLPQGAQAVERGSVKKYNAPDGKNGRGKH